nr:thymidylate synthase [Clostridia bacterium]
MTEADKNFIETCKEILDHGYSSEGTNVRTRWEDGTEANYISVVGVSNKYDVGKEFPMITLRNTKGTLKRAIDEVLWIWQKKSNRVEDLNSHIWNQWKREDGTIGKAYGYQMGKKYEFKTKDGIKEMDQVDFVLYLLKN